MPTIKKATMHRSLLILAYIAFVSLGLPDGLLGVAWPTMRSSFDQPLDALGLILIASTCGYMISSFFSGLAIARIGIGGLLALSCLATGCTLLGYAVVSMWWMVIALCILGGLGAGAIDAGLNNYIQSHYGERCMQWLHASYGIGITMGPLIMTWGISMLKTWRFGYSTVGIIQLFLAFCFFLSASLWDNTAEMKKKVFSERPAIPVTAPFFSTLKNRLSWLSALLFFVYVGIELSLGQWSYTLLTESRAIAPTIAGVVTGGYWGFFTVGRILAGLYTPKIGAKNLVNYSLEAALIGASLVWLNLSNFITIVGIGMVGFAIAPIFPAMVSGTTFRVGKWHTSNTIGMQMACAGLGIAIVPSVAGVLARSFYIEIIPPYLMGLILLLLSFHSLANAKRYNPCENI